MKWFQATTAATAAAWAACESIEGDGGAVVDNAAALEEANERSVLFLRQPRPELLTRRAGLVFAYSDFNTGAVPQDRRPACLARCRFPEAAFARFLANAFSEPPRPGGVHANALVHPAARIGSDVYVGPFAVVEEDASIGAGTVVSAGCFVGRGASVGAGCTLYPHVTLYPGVAIGNHCIIHAGAVIGADGFGYTQCEAGVLKVPQVGAVVIEDDVEIGANAAIDRGTVSDTRIGRGVKIDNLVQIAHNCEVGAGTMISGQAGLAGSTRVGKDVLIGGQVGIAGHVTIGDGARIAAQSGVDTNVKAGESVAGYPARPRWLFWRMVGLLERAAREHRKGRPTPG